MHLDEAVSADAPAGTVEMMMMSHSIEMKRADQRRGQEVAVRRMIPQMNRNEPSRGELTEMHDPEEHEP